MRLIVGPTLILMLLGTLVGIGQRWVRRWWFLRTRPNRASVMPAAVEAMLHVAMQQSPMIVDVTASSGPASPPTERLSFEPSEGSERSSAEANRARRAGDDGPNVLVSEAPEQRAAASGLSSPEFMEPTSSQLRNPEFPSAPAVPFVDVPESPMPSYAPGEQHWMSSTRPSTPVPEADPA